MTAGIEVMDLQGTHQVQYFTKSETNGDVDGFGRVS